MATLRISASACILYVRNWLALNDDAHNDDVEALAVEKALIHHLAHQSRWCGFRALFGPRHSTGFLRAKVTSAADFAFVWFLGSVPLQRDQEQSFRPIWHRNSLLYKNCCWKGGSSNLGIGIWLLFKLNWHVITCEVIRRGSRWQVKPVKLTSLSSSACHWKWDLSRMKKNCRHRVAIFVGESLARRRRCRNIFLSFFGLF